jgi:predicted phosphodiesterase
LKIALFSDIHANLPALEAISSDMEKRRPDAVYCLGDLVGYAPWPNEVIAEIRRRGIPTIAGNYDQGIGLHSDDCGCAYKTDEEKEMGAISISFTNELVSDDARHYLKTLPAHLMVKFDPGVEKFNLLLVHGSPRKINEYLFEDRPDAGFLRMMQQADADIMAFGHTHKPYYKELIEESVNGKRYRHAINIGSVGKPKDGDPRGCYTMLEVNENTGMQTSGSMKVELIRVKYDVEKAAKAVEASSLPSEYADMLRKGYQTI